MSLKIFEWKNPEKRQFLINSYNIDGSYRFPLHSHHNHWEFVYCEEGFFHHEVNGNVLRHSGGDLIFIREGDRHLLKGREFRYTNMAFSRPWLDSLREIGGEKLISSLTESPDPPFVSVPAVLRSDLEGRIRSLLGRERSGVRELRFSLLIHYMVDLFLQKGEGAEESELPDWVKDVVNFAESAGERIPSLEEIVERSYRCSEHVSRSFRKYLGQTPTEFLKDLKLRRAAELLRSTNYPVKEIGGLCSYENGNYFHKQFREKYGLTPLEYRQNYARRIH